MNHIQNEKTLAGRDLNPLIRVWRSSGDPRMPLTSTWVRTDTTPLHPTVRFRRTAS